MRSIIHLSPTDVIEKRPFTHPDHTFRDKNTLHYMINQLCLILENPHLATDVARTILFNVPDQDSWIHRIVLAQPERLRNLTPLTLVGFFGQRREDANLELAHEFDNTLIKEIPENPDLLSYSTIALQNDDYANMVIFANPEALNDWSRSQAHAQAVNQLAPGYYWSIRLYNGILPQGIADGQNLHLVRAKYFDYSSDPMWHAIREMQVH